MTGRKGKSRRSPGEGTIYRRKDGRWEASIQAGGVRRSVYGRTRQEAAAKLEQLRAQLRRSGKLADPGGRTVADLLEAWLAVVSPGLKPRSVADYRKVVDRYILPALGQLKLAKLGPADLERFYAELKGRGLKRAPSMAHAVLRRALGFAVRWGWLDANAAERVERPAYRPGTPPTWTPAQLKAFLEGTAGDDLWPLWVLLTTTGLRLSEALALRWADVDLGAGTVFVRGNIQRIGGRWVLSAPKTPAGLRLITLPALAVEALKRQRERTGRKELVFASAASEGPIHPTTAQHALKRACQRLGLPALTPHQLRHLHASLLLAERVPITAVAGRLGHSSPQVTAQIYAHVIRGLDDMAARAFDRLLEGAGGRR
jgi:integrase